MKAEKLKSRQNEYPFIMKKLALLCFGLLFFIFSCQSEKDEIPQPENIDAEFITLPNGIVLEKVEDYYLFEEDIMLTELQVQDLRQTDSRAVARNIAGVFWPGGIVPYVLDSGFEQTASLATAINHYHSNTIVRWVPRTNETNYVKFLTIDGSMNWSAIGMYGGEQSISLSSNSPGIIIHEMAHALGLYHEMSRSDRDNYVNINWENIWSGELYRNQFKTYVERGLDGQDIGDFDIESIMMYGSYQMTANLRPTVVKKDGTIIPENRSHLTPKDISAINYLYAYKPPVLTQYSEIIRAGTHKQFKAEYASSGGNLTYEWRIPSGVSASYSVDRSTATLTFSNSGTYTIECRVKEGTHTSDWGSSTVSVTGSFNPGNTPTVTGINNVLTGGGAKLTARILGFDHDYFEWGVPSGATLYGYVDQDKRSIVYIQFPRAGNYTITCRAVKGSNVTPVAYHYVTVSASGQTDPIPPIF